MLRGGRLVRQVRIIPWYDVPVGASRRHDDLDVEFGKIKAKFGGSSAGHNGIASIDKFIGKDYSRVRIGIGKPKGNIEVADYVLQNFDEDESLGIEKISNHINDSISFLVEKKLDLFSSTVNNK